MGCPMFLICTVYLIFKFCGIKISKAYSYYLACVGALFVIISTTYVLNKVVQIEKNLSNKNIEKVIIEPQKFRKTNKSNEVYNPKKLRKKTRKLVNFHLQKESFFLLTGKIDFINNSTFSIPKIKSLFLSEKFDYCRNALKIRKKNYAPCIKRKFCLLRIFKNNPKIKVFLRQNKIYKGLLKIDHRIFKLINSNLKCKTLDLYMSAQSYCDSKKINLSFIIILVLSIVILWSNKKEHSLEILILFASTLAISATTNYFFKHCFERARPLVVLGDANVNVLFERSYENSFPSGHTQLVFTVCTFMLVVVRKYFILYAILACGVGFERVYAGSHFPSDVAAGALLGILFAYVILFFSKKIKYKTNF
jgi:undecaprenyl-diphosphatase